MVGSGVTAAGGRIQDPNYANYDQFLNSSYLQKASGAVHDWFNARGLSVRNKAGVQYEVGGDDTLLTLSAALGAELAGRAAHLSQQAIAQLLAMGSTSKELEPESIFELVPQEVVADPGKTNKTYPLEAWNDDKLRSIYYATIFPDVMDSLSNLGVRVFSSEMVMHGVAH
jgi:hypothetical protein